jgi:phosphoserine phosphatase
VNELFDFDGTLVPERNSLYWHLIHLLPDVRWRAVKTVAFTNTLAGLVGAVSVGAVDTDQMFKLLLLNTFSGLPVDLVDVAADRMADRVDSLVYPEMAPFLAADRGEERRCLVTSNTEPIVGAFCKRHRLECVATRLHVIGGRYSGLVDGELNKGPEKVARLQHLGIELSRATAYGNTLDDEAMLRAAATPVLVDPDDDLAMRRHFNEARRIEVGTGGR